MGGVRTASTSPALSAISSASRAFGGAVRYGTDLGNGPLPVGLNRRELLALEGSGLTVPAIVESLRGYLPPDPTSTTNSVIPDAAAIDDLTLDDLLTATVTTKESA